MSLSERLAALLSTEEEEEDVKDEGVKPEKDEGVKPEKDEGVEKANKPKLVRKQITLGARPINVDLSKEVKRFNK